MKAKLLLLFAVFVVVASGGCGGSGGSVQSENERVIQAMTLEEKVGQLFIIRPEQMYSELPPEEMHYHLQSFDAEFNDVMRETLRQYPIGSFSLYRRNIKSPEQLRKYITDLKDASNITPFICVDEEGGVVARLGNHSSFDVPKPAPMQEIGDTGDPQNAYNAGYTIGGYIKDYGFTVDFAPVADVNTSSDNVIASRTFGSDPELVSEMVGAYLDGLHAQGIMGTMKHFPGAGDTSDYLAVSKTWEELLQCELIPFIDNLDKTDLIMTSHITFPNVYSEDIPAALSHELLTNRLRGELGYNGVLMTDGMEMRVITNILSSDEAAVKAVEAGNDIILLPFDYRAAFNAVVDAVRSGRLSESRIDESVNRIFNLKFKY